VPPHQIVQGDDKGGKGLDGGVTQLLTGVITTFTLPRALGLAA